MKQDIHWTETDHREGGCNNYTPHLQRAGLSYFSGEVI